VIVGDLRVQSKMSNSFENFGNNKKTNEKS